MWYFTWILGIGFALSFGIINATWNEFRIDDEDDEDNEEFEVQS